MPVVVGDVKPLRWVAPATCSTLVALGRVDHRSAYWGRIVMPSGPAGFSDLECPDRFVVEPARPTR